MAQSDTEAHGHKQDVYDGLGQNRRKFSWAGAGFILAGLLAIVFPAFSTVFFELFIGWILIFSGIMYLIKTFSVRGTGSFLWALLVSLVTLATGILLVIFPISGMLALTVVLAAAFVIQGLYMLSFGLALRPRRNWAWSLVSGIVSITLGIIIALGLPGAALVTLGIIIGVNLIFTGASMIAVGRGLGERPADPYPPAA